MGKVRIIVPGVQELTQWAVALISNFAAHLAAEGGARAATDVAAKSTAGKEEEAERSAQFESAFELLQHLTSFLAEAPSLSDVRFCICGLGFEFLIISVCSLRRECC